MTSLSAGWRRLRRIWRRDAGTDIDAELGFHFDQKVAGLQARGGSIEDARAQALEEFGDVDGVKRDLHEIAARLAVKHRRAEWWEPIAQDAGYVLRTLRRSPAFTAMVAATLALGIGANAVIFSLLARLFAREPAAVTAPAQLYRLQQRCKVPRCDVAGRFTYSYPELRAVRAALPGDAPIAAYLVDHVHFGADDDAPAAVISYVEGDFFGTLGLHPSTGRFFSADEARIQNVAPLAVISHQLWTERFGRASNVVGQVLEVESQRYTIIGVAPAGFTGLDLDAADLWVPASTMRPVDPGAPWYDQPGGGGRLFRFLTRATSPAVIARMVAGAGPVLRQTVRDSTATVALVKVAEPIWTDKGTVVTISTRLAGVAAIVLLIACANVANLFLARGMQRRREIAVRVALGVSRRRLVGQLLGESIFVATIGGAAAALVAIWGGSVLRQLLMPNVRWGAPAMDMRVAAFTAVVALLAGVAAGLAPALQASRPDLTSALKAGAREGTFRRSRLQTGLLVVQGALSVVLLAGAGLFVESLRHVEAVDIGYDADRLVLASVRYANDNAIANPAARTPELKAHMPEIAGRIARIPGVISVGLAEEPLMAAVSINKIFLPDRDSFPKLNGVPPLATTVSPEYLSSVGIHVVAGRGITESDILGNEPVIVVSASMAKVVWPGENALGKCVIVGATRTDPCRTVVGVVSEGHLVQIIETPFMRYYLPLAQRPLATPAEIVIRVVPARAEAVGAQARALLADGLGAWAHPRITSMRERLAPQLRPWRLGASLFSGAALLALLVAAVGVYSTIAYAVTQRAHEMGVRVALGARAPDILRLVVGEGVRVVAIGVVIGSAIALALGKLVASMLYATSPRDPVVLAGTALTLLLVAVAACVVPAWRATRVDPVTALRAE